VAAQLRRVLPDDTNVFTRAELATNEVRHWMVRTSTGLVFGFGVIVAFIVGLVILFQTLSTQITRHLPEFATLKAIGYSERELASIVVAQAILMTAVALVPACLLATAIYAVVRSATVLPIFMTLPRIAAVVALAFAMSVGSAVLSLRALRRADPVDLF
jgi:putative ABC transport system permease protein